MYMLVWSPAGLSGFDWVWIALGVMLDIMKWGQVANKRKQIPGYATISGGETATASAYPAATPTATAQQPAIASAPAEEQDDYIAELERLGQMHEQGIITDEEFEAKKQKILGL